jgi:hypothetical protein
MREVRIEPKEEGKGRTFFSTCLATVECDNLWEGGQTSTDTVRPVWAMFAGSEQELRPFIANVTLGKKILIGGDRNAYRRKEDRMEFLKSTGYQTVWQREPEGSVVTVFLPDLFQLDPGMVDPSGAAFIILPPTAWAASQKIEAEPILDHVMSLEPNLEACIKRDDLAQLVPLSFLFGAYLDRRTRCPLVSDGRFYLQLMLACLDKGLASWSGDGYSRRFGVHARFRFTEEGTARIGLDQGLAFQASHESIESVLSQQVELFFSIVKG